jgi:hypothetical protein
VTTWADKKKTKACTMRYAVGDERLEGDGQRLVRRRWRPCGKQRNIPAIDSYQEETVWSQATGHIPGRHPTEPGAGSCTSTTRGSAAGCSNGGSGGWHGCRGRRHRTAEQGLWGLRRNQERLCTHRYMQRAFESTCELAVSAPRRKGSHAGKVAITATADCTPHVPSSNNTTGEVSSVSFSPHSPADTQTHGATGFSMTLGDSIDTAITQLQYTRHAHDARGRKTGFEQGPVTHLLRC